MKRILENFAEYQHCCLCPRHCGINRYTQVGYCGENAGLTIDSALLHFGEEPPISFQKGSGTIFFNGCSLRCVFCQNMQISQTYRHKKQFTITEFIGMMETLIEKGAENINLVSPDHFMPHIIAGLRDLRAKGYTLPVIYNCSGYETIDHLTQTLPWIDIYLIDYKFSDSAAAKICANAPDYPDVALTALDFLWKQKGNLMLDENGKARQGILVRHLVLPGMVNNSLKVVENLYSHFGNEVFLSLMSQYTPRYLKPGHIELNRRLLRNEYEKIENYVMDLDFTNGFIQEYIEGNDHYIPDFDQKNMFDEW